MNRRTMGLLVALALALALVLAMTGPVVAGADMGVTGWGRYIVLLQDTALNEGARAHLGALGAEIVKDMPLADGYVVLLPGSLPEQALWNIPGVRVVGQDGLVQAVKGRPPWAGPKEAPPATPWGVDRIDADLVWDSNTGVGSRVAVLDTGIDVDHPDLAVAGGYNAIDPEASWDDDSGHGTHVAGIIAALRDAGEDTGLVTGVAPGATLHAVKVLNASGSGYISDVVEGIYWAIDPDGNPGTDDGMDVINLSLGTSQDYSALETAVSDAVAAGIVVVAAAGNEGNPPGKGDTVLYPARYGSVIAVGATDEADERPKWSGTGPDLDLVAPGVDVLSTSNDGGYEPMSGTSMASPHVAGTVALILASPPGSYDLDGDSKWDPDEVVTCLRSTADDLGATGFDTKYGYGLVDAEEAATGTETDL